MKLVREEKTKREVAGMIDRGGEGGREGRKKEWKGGGIE